MLDKIKSNFYFLQAITSLLAGRSRIEIMQSQERGIRDLAQHFSVLRQIITCTLELTISCFKLRSMVVNMCFVILEQRTIQLFSDESFFDGETSSQQQVTRGPMHLLPTPFNKEIRATTAFLK